MSQQFLAYKIDATSTIDAPTAILPRSRLHLRPTAPSYEQIPQVIADQISLRLRSDRADTSSSLSQRVVLFQQPSLSGSDQLVPVDLFHHATEREEQDFCLCQRGLEIDLAAQRTQDRQLRCSGL